MQLIKHIAWLLLSFYAWFNFIDLPPASASETPSVKRCFFSRCFCCSKQMPASTQAPSAMPQGIERGREPDILFHLFDTNFVDTIQQINQTGLSHHLILANCPGFFPLAAAAANRNRDFDHDQIFLFSELPLIQQIWEHGIFPCLEQHDTSRDFLKGFIAFLVKNSSTYFKRIYSSIDLQYLAILERRGFDLGEVGEMVRQSHNLGLMEEVEKICERFDRLIELKRYLDSSWVEDVYKYIKHLHQDRRIHFFFGSLSDAKFATRLANAMRETGEQIGLLKVAHLIETDSAGFSWEDHFREGSTPLITDETLFIHSHLQRVSKRRDLIHTNDGLEIADEHASRFPLTLQKIDILYEYVSMKGVASWTEKSWSQRLAEEYTLDHYYAIYTKKSIRNRSSPKWEIIALF